MDKTRLLEYFLVRENLRNLQEDLKLWSGEP